MKASVGTVAGRTAPVFVILGTLLVVLIVGGLAFRLLNDSLSFDRAALRAHALGTAALTLQLDEETGVRGYAATHERVLLQPYVEGARTLEATLSALTASAARVGLNAPDADVTAMQSVHARWLREVAAPLIRDEVRGSRAQRMQLRGKTLIDRYRAYDAVFVGLIEARIAQHAGDARASFMSLSIFGGCALSIGLLGIAFAVREQARLGLQLDRQTAVVQTLQRAFTNRKEVLPQTTIGSAYLSASAEAQVGGDFFDVRRLDSRRGYVIIADVSGKGVEAAVDTALIKYSINALAQHASDDPGAVLAGLNSIFLDTKDGEASFVVAFLGIFDYRTLSLSYASAGHSPAFLRRDGAVEQLAVTGPVIGLYPADTFGTKTLLLRHGDTLVLATDGLTEARDADDVLLSDGGAMRWIAEAPDDDPQGLVDAILDRLGTYTQADIRDDLALLALKIVGNPAPAAVKVAAFERV